MNSCLAGDGVGVDAGGNFDGTDPAQCGHALADSRDPEQTACFCDTTDPRDTCFFCDTANPDHYLNPAYPCFCNPTISTEWCFDSCMADTCPGADDFCFVDLCLLQ